MNDIAKEIIPISIEEELKNSYLDYAMSVIIGRALPDVRDGLKPVHRRILYAMNVLGNDWNKAYKKSARIVGDVIGKYHPHGDSAVYDTIVRMAQPFSLRYTLVDGQGNFGSIDGDSAAAMRYTEIRLAKITHEIMADLKKETVDFIDNYDGTEKIPDVMPTKIPNLLINGSSGIAVGMTTNIPPHNITEVISGCLAYLENENISIEELMKHIPGPDFPTAAIIIGKHGIEEAYRTGRGKIYIRARAKIEVNDKTGRETILINEIPYQVNKTNLLERIASLVKEKHIEGISSLRDESDKDGMCIVIEIKRDAIGEVVLNNLYSKTQLQISFGINMVALQHGQPSVMNLKDIIKAFIYHRRDVMTRRSIFELSKARHRAHIIEALLIALVNIEQIVKLIRLTPATLEIKKILVSHPWNIASDKISLLENINNNYVRPEWLEPKFGVNGNRYYLTEQQAQAILDLRLQRLTNLEFEKIFDEYKSLLKQIKNLLFILSNSKHLIEVIRQELKVVKDQFGDNRRTEIISEKKKINIEDMIDSKDVIITLSYQGYIKYQSLDDYNIQHRGGKGKSAVFIKDKDFVSYILVANTHDIILCFSNYGRLYWIKVYHLPETSRGSRGRPIINLLPLRNGERITAMLAMKQYNENTSIFMVTAKGIVKKLAINIFNRPRSIGIIVISLHDNDELIGVDLISESNEVMLFSAAGKVVRFKEETVRYMGRIAVGVQGIKLLHEDRVVSLIVLRDKSAILTVTQNGYGKRTDEKNYPIKSRNIHGITAIKITKRNGYVIGSVQINECDQIIMITNKGMLIRTRVSEISMVGRNTNGVMIFRIADDEKIIGIQKC